MHCFLPVPRWPWESAMYCVRCGVRLQEGTESCPLCGTPVWNPDQASVKRIFPEEMPRQHEESSVPIAVGATVVGILSALIIFIICMKKYGEMRWGGYALAGIALAYILFALPAWFRRPPVEVFLPVDYAAIILFLLYINQKTGGHWFLSFAFPVTAGCGLLTTALVCMLKHVRKGRLIIIGSFMILLGGFTILTEFLEFITFGSGMFQWSLYTAALLGICGIFMILSGIIPAMRHHLKKRFFY